MSIKFGTDGWRGVIALDYTFDNVAKVSQATGQWLLKTYGAHPKVAIGHDCRFGGAEFTRTAAQTFASMGIRVMMADRFTSTPAISLATLRHSCNAGIVITASHNPPSYNGFKIKADFGGPATPAQIAAVESELDQLNSGFNLKTFEDLIDEGIVTRHSFTNEYLDDLRSKLDIDSIRNSTLKIAYDAMFGAGRGMVTELLGSERVTALHVDDNPGFHGQAPEPIGKNLTELSSMIVRDGCDVGLATDGDADRIGMFDENGEFVDSHRLLALLVKYLHEERGLSGDIVKTFSTTDMLDKMGRAYGLKVHTTQIGFKYIGPRIVEGDVLVGGEESGGMAVKGHIPERDGIFIGLLIVEMMVRRGKRLSELVQELFDQFGSHYSTRNDLHTEKKDAVMALLQSDGLKEVAGKPVTSVQTLDGVKFFTEDGWLLFRPSGTEPLLRIYSEAASPELAEEIVAAGVALVASL